MKLVIPPAFIFIVSLFFCLPSDASAQSKNCAVMEGLLVESSWKPSGSGRLKLTLKFDDSRIGEYAIMIISHGQDTKVFKNKEREFSNLKAGLYDVHIVDRKGCSKQLNLNVK